jgi:hypothetical protein
VIPLNDLCTVLPTTDVCLLTSHASRTNVMELATTLSSRDVSTALPRYDGNQISTLIRNDISRILRNHRTDANITKTNSVVHFVDNRIHSTTNIKNTLVSSTKSSADSDQSDILRVSPVPSTIILKQISNSKIGFDFLTNAELMSFLNAIMSTIDKSYKITDISESLILFSQLIIAQSVYILRSCPIRQEHIPSVQSCLIVSTLFLRPSIENDIAFSVYRLISLPAIVNGEQFMYSNMPEAIGINTADQTVILWDSAPKKNECLFSIFVYCQKKPPPIEISTSPCLSELFSNNTRIASSCPITRSHKIQTGIINIDSNVWLFSHTEKPLYCHIYSNAGKLNDIIAISEPSIIRMPCGNTIKCTNTLLPSTTCANRSILIKSATTEKHEQLSNIAWSLKNMTKQLLSTYSLTTKNSFKDILDDLKDNRLTVTTAIKEFGTTILSIIFLLLLSFILFFIRWIKRIVQKRIDTLAKDVDDLVHEAAKCIKNIV